MFYNLRVWVGAFPLVVAVLCVTTLLAAADTPGPQTTPVPAAASSATPPAAAQPAATTQPAAADQSAAPPTPVEAADSLNNKLTLSYYSQPTDHNYDINLRHQLGKFGVWVADFDDPSVTNVARAGGEYDYQKGKLLWQPSLEAATNGGIAGGSYMEIGDPKYLILGYSRTDLRPFQDLFFNPSESVQLGAGRRINSYDKVYAYSIFDVRLHTEQQDTHAVWRHRLSSRYAITTDGVFKSGQLYQEDGRYVHAVGIGFYLDAPTWFAKLYLDPYVNFTDSTMVRVAYGFKY